MTKRTNHVQNVRILQDKTFIPRMCLETYVKSGYEKLEYNLAVLKLASIHTELISNQMNAANLVLAVDQVLAKEID